jgi:hypothetical protein
MNPLNFRIVKPEDRARAARRFEKLYLPPAAEPSRWVWALDILGGILWIAAIGTVVALTALAVAS